MDVEYEFINNWTEYAACVDVDPELFFPVNTSAPCRSQIERAKAVCTRCPVRSECLERALETPKGYRIYGVWAGLDEDELNALRGQHTTPVRRMNEVALTS